MNIPAIVSFTHESKCGLVGKIIYTAYFPSKNSPGQFFY